MEPVDQKITNSTEGDCLRACIASILELDDKKIMNFGQYNDSRLFWFKVNSWTRENLDYLFLPIILSTPHSRLIENLYYISVGETSRGTQNHAVVAINGKTIHDPHPSREGLLKEEYIVIPTSIKTIKKEGE